MWCIWWIVVSYQCPIKPGHDIKGTVNEDFRAGYARAGVALLLSVSYHSKLNLIRDKFNYIMTLFTVNILHLTVFVVSWFTQMMIKAIDNNIYLLKIYLHVFFQTRFSNKNLKQFLCLVMFFLLQLNLSLDKIFFF